MPAPTDRFVPLVLAMLAAMPSLAQVPTWPSPSAIERASQSQPFPSPERLGTQTIPQPPRIEPRKPGLDLDALARAHSRLQAPDSHRATTPPTLRIFVTLDMPRGSLDRLTDQAERSGAVLVLRGLKDQSMRTTLEVVQSLIGERRVAWTIDPEAFTRYAIAHAPTFVLTLATAPDTTAACGTHCPIPAPFVKVAGDVSMDYALDAIVRQHPPATTRAAPLLQRLRSSR